VLVGVDHAREDVQPRRVDACLSPGFITRGGDGGDDAVANAQVTQPRRRPGGDQGAAGDEQIKR
jgi:hypothetical protein